MDDTLSVHLQDHLAGAEYAVDLVEFLREHHKDEELANFAGDLLVELKEDQDILRQIAERAGQGLQYSEGADGVVHRENKPTKITTRRRKQSGDIRSPRVSSTGNLWQVGSLGRSGRGCFSRPAASKHRF